MSLQEDSIECVFITPGYFDQVVEFAADHFALDEPLLNSLGVTDSPMIRHYFRHSIEQGTSVMAIDTADNNRIVGVRAHRVTKITEPEIPLEKLPSEDPLIPVLKLLAHCQDRYDPKKELKVDEFLYFKFLCVRQDCRGRNIGFRMTEFTFDFMRKEKIPVAYVFASSAYSQRVFLKLNFEIVDEMPYEDYQVDGRVVFKMDGIHTKCACLIKWVE